MSWEIEVPLYGSSRLGVWRPDREAETTGWELFDTDPMTGTGGGIAGGWERGRVQFELSNHLGNVLVTISDVRIPVLVPEGIELCDDPVHPDCYRPIDYYLPQILTANDYYPFGMGMPGRKFAEGNYRYGFNGQERSTEIDPTGNSMTAEFWQYDARLGRRWNLDPKPTIGVSLYSGFNNNPIWFNDLLGDTTVPQGDWYRRQIGKNITYKYAAGSDKEQLDANSKTWWKIPESSRNRAVSFGKKFAPTEVQSSIDLHPDGTFTVLKTDIREGAVDGHIKWGMQLPNGGHLNVEARDYMQSKAVDEGAFWGQPGHSPEIRY